MMDTPRVLPDAKHYGRNWGCRDPRRLCEANMTQKGVVEVTILVMFTTCKCRLVLGWLVLLPARPQMAFLALAYVSTRQVEGREREARRERREREKKERGETGAAGRDRSSTAHASPRGEFPPGAL